MNYLEFMFHDGFFGTRAPLFMDIVTLIVSVLPFLVAGAIALARRKNYKAHAYTQVLIFAFSVIVLLYFEFGVRMAGGFDAFMKESSVHYTYALVVLILHIGIAIITLLIWTKTIFRAKVQLQNKTHKKAGLYTFIGVIFTSLTGIWVYLLMFVF